MPRATTITTSSRSASSVWRAGSSAQAGGDVKVFVDTAAVMEKPLAAAAGIGWQGKHTNLVSRQFGSWLFLGAHLHHARPAARPGRGRSLRDLPGLPRRLPDRGVSRPLSPRCAALHLLPHHRAQGPDPARAAAADGQPHLWLRRLPRRVPVEQVRPAGPRGEARRARDLRAPALADLAGLDDPAFPPHVRQDRHQAHRARPLRAQRADRHRQQRRCRSRDRRRAAAGRSGAAGARRGGVGAVAAPPAGRFSQRLRRDIALHEADAEVARRMGGRPEGEPLEHAALPRLWLLRPALRRPSRRPVRSHHRHHPQRRQMRQNSAPCASADARSR